jgi:hypothetical protein
MVVGTPETQVMFLYYSPNEHIPPCKYKLSALIGEEQKAQKILNFKAISLK